MTGSDVPPEAPSLFIRYHELRFAAVSIVGRLRGCANGFRQSEHPLIADMLDEWAEELAAILAKQGLDLSAGRNAPPAVPKETTNDVGHA